MAERAKITKSSARTIGKEVGKRVEKLDNRLKNIERELKSLSGDISSLESRIEEIERTKARAQRQAIEDHKDRVHEQLQEKREKFRQRQQAVLSEYRSSISRLKERFLNSISGRHDQFQQVEAEFDDVREQRAAAVEAAAAVGDEAAAGYRERLEAVETARAGFLDAIDDFLVDREGTAATIDALQTDLRGISDTTRVQVPFWVVGVEVDGVEELRVYPVLEDTGHRDDIGRGHPFTDPLRTDPDHGYEDMTEAVRSYVSRDDVWDSLVEEEQTFADPSVLLEEGLATERFVDSLADYELGERDVDGGTDDRDRRGRREREQEVAAADGGAAGGDRR